jgi:hypothetical protein
MGSCSESQDWPRTRLPRLHRAIPDSPSACGGLNLASELGTRNFEAVWRANAACFKRPVEHGNLLSLSNRNVERPSKRLPARFRAFRRRRNGPQTDGRRSDAGEMAAKRMGGGSDGEERGESVSG